MAKESEVDGEGGLDDELVESGALIVVPGEEITRAGGFLCGHGTHKEVVGLEDEDNDDEKEMVRVGEALVAGVAGVVTRINKLISVDAVKSRYSGDVGDVVIGRVVEVGNKQWKIDVGARQLATLMLGSTYLPGGAQRRRTLEDQLQMRIVFAENDLLSAEVATFYQHGGLSINTRNMRYGKLSNGQLIQVPPSLVKRLSQHFVTLPCGVDAIFGLNGKIWVTCSKKESNSNGGGDMDGDKDMSSAVDRTRMTELMEQDKMVHERREIEAQERLKIARVRNCILLLAEYNYIISPQNVMKIFRKSIKVEPKSMLSPDIAEKLVKTL